MHRRTPEQLASWAPTSKRPGVDTAPGKPTRDMFVAGERSHHHTIILGGRVNEKRAIQECHPKLGGNYKSALARQYFRHYLRSNTEAHYRGHGSAM